MKGKKNKKKNLRKKFNKGSITYFQLRKYRNIAIYQLIDNEKEIIIGFQVFTIETTPAIMFDTDIQVFKSPQTELYQFDAVLHPDYRKALHVYTEILKASVK